jgi:hypothetical protein
MPDEVLDINTDEMRSAADKLNTIADELDAAITTATALFDTAAEPASEGTVDSEPSPVRQPAVDALDRTKQQHTAVVKALSAQVRADAALLLKQAAAHEAGTAQAVSEIDQIVTV